MDLVLLLSSAAPATGRLFIKVDPPSTGSQISVVFTDSRLSFSCVVI
uniref:Uncharacterized protein n=1 Tax=Manihot esculenta TaxID=3983 RepID=A0A2C9WDS4_MANES